MSEKYIDRINALLAKAESTDSPEEAALFTAKAQELMLKHAIDEAMLRKETTEGFIAETITLHHTSSHARRIITYLALPAVCAMGTCRGYLVTRQAKSFMIVGRAEDIAANKRMIESLIAQGMSQMKVWAATDPHFLFLDRANQRNAKGQFLVSFGLEVSRRLSEKYTEVVATTGAELVLANRLAPIDRFMTEQFGQLRKVTHRMNGHAYGREEGRAAGQRANLGDQVSAR